MLSMLLTPLPLLLLQLAAVSRAFPHAGSVNFISDTLNTWMQTSQGKVALRAFGSVENEKVMALLNSNSPMGKYSRLYWYTLGYPMLVPYSGVGNRTEDYILESEAKLAVQMEFRSEQVARALARRASRKLNASVSSEQIHLLEITSLICNLSKTNLGTPDSNYLSGNLIDALHHPLQVDFVGNFKSHKNYPNYKNALKQNVEFELTCNITYRHMNGSRSVVLYLPPTHKTKIQDAFEMSSSSEVLEELEKLKEELQNNISKVSDRLGQVEAALVRSDGLLKPSRRAPKVSGLQKVSVNGRTFVVIQRRSSHHVSFEKNWTEYEKGFGDEGNRWIGLERISALTARSPKTLRVELTRFNGGRYFAEFLGFRVLGPEMDYLMTYRRMDSRRSNFRRDALQTHKNMRFSTKDNDNDRSSTNCAEMGRSGWWFNDCFEANPNGMYYTTEVTSARHVDAIHWMYVAGNTDALYSFKEVRLMLLENGED